MLAEPGAWRALARTLRTGKLEIGVHEPSLLGFTSPLTPEPIDVNVKVVLIGGPEIYALLDHADPDFPHLFKVLADFDSTIPAEPAGVEGYAGVLARITSEEGLPPFRACAVSALAEHGARISGRRDRLTTRFGRLADLAREAAWLARKEGRELVTQEYVRASIARGRQRADLPARRFRRLVREGTLRIETRGEAVGQINGLAVVSAGPLTYGFPSRITATIGPGSSGVINIERESQLSGAIHTKGFYILGGLLRHLLRGMGMPLAFSASIAFEQSYGGIDGDSASGAEMCCLLSALTGVPLSQSFAMTGAIDQFGAIQAIGAVSEKVEGFYDTCTDAGLTGEQGVLIPRSNLVDLMLRPDVAAACSEGRFHVYAVDTIFEALEVLSGMEAGRADEDGLYPEDSLLALAMERAAEFLLVARHPELLGVEELEEEDEDAEADEDGQERYPDIQGELGEEA